MRTSFQGNVTVCKVQNPYFAFLLNFFPVFTSLRSGSPMEWMMEMSRGVKKTPNLNIEKW